MIYDIAKKNEFDIHYYQKQLEELYSKINTKREFSDLYGYLDRTSGFLPRVVLSEAKDIGNFIRPISWLFSLSSKIGVDVQDAFLKKYPGICPYCLEPHCVCFKTNKKPPKPIPGYQAQQEMEFKYRAIRDNVKPYNLDKAVNNIREIYAVNEVIWHIAGARHHLAKIHEEIAEIHEAYGVYQKNKNIDPVAKIAPVASEIADVFAWILGAWAILFPNESLDTVFIDYYYDGCPVCKVFPCKCTPYDNRIVSLLDYKVVISIKNDLNQLASIVTRDFRDEINELIKSYNATIDTQNEPTTRLTISGTEDSLKKLKGLIPDTDGKNTEILSLIDKILRAIKVVLKQDDQPVLSKRYDVFLSYAAADKDEARKISSFLSKKKLAVFLSEKDIKPSSKWEDDIKNALKNSGLVCVLATPNSLKSEWVMSEWAVAWGDGIRILPILFQCSISDLPDRLKAHQAINFHEMTRIVEFLKKPN